MRKRLGYPLFCGLAACLAGSLLRADEPIKLHDGFVGFPYEFQLPVGAPPMAKWKLVSKEVPEDLKFDEKTGKIAGTPKAARALPYTLVFERQSSGTPPEKLSFSLTIHPGPEPCPGGDCREDLEFSIYLGIAVDTFAAGETRRYLNAQSTTGFQERGVGGFDFDFRLSGHKDRSKSQLWVFGETVHGARSSDVDCNQHKEFPSCAAFDKVRTATGDQASKELLFIIRNATSLEGFMGLRLESRTFNPSSESAFKGYFKAQAGFLKVLNGPDDAVDMHHLGAGVIATNGKFQGSYLEAGWGRTDLFVTKPRNRLKVDGFGTWQISDTMSFFAQIFVDSDLGRGADSIQTYLGVSFDLAKILKKRAASQ